MWKKITRKGKSLKIIVKVYGRYKNITGKQTVQLDITDGNTLRDLIDVFVKHYPDTEKDKKRILVTKNKMITSYDTTITEEDEITIAPPVVSGG
jgi:molybdopterin converting factor small subunit